MTKRRLTQDDYDRDFDKKKIAALNGAHDNRRFEIELYWKRASYFWTFIGATFAGYFAVHAVGVDDNQDMSVILASVGLVFSFAWYCVNRGSKKWQENWEKHVDLLEDDITGPLHKTVLTRNDQLNRKEIVHSFFTGPAPFSVSKINQLISFYVFLVWVFLLIYSLLPFNIDAGINWVYVAIVSISILACVSFVTLGQTYKGGYWHIATTRKSRIRPNDEQGDDAKETSESQ